MLSQLLPIPVWQIHGRNLGGGHARTNDPESWALGPGGNTSRRRNRPGFGPRQACWLCDTAVRSRLPVTRYDDADVPPILLADHPGLLAGEAAADTTRDRSRWQPIAIDPRPRSLTQRPLSAAHA